jgi:Tetracyclin repressor-like, C-terminal domain
VQGPAAREVLTQFLAGRTATMTVIVDRAVRRGEVPAGTDAADIIRTVTALIYYRLFIAGEPPSDGLADGAAAIAAAIAAAAARAGAGQNAPPAYGPRRTLALPPSAPGPW